MRKIPIIGFPFRIETNEVGNTLTTDGNRILIFEDRTIRCLTPRECARMQGFPDSFKLPETKTQAYRQIGNSVPVPIITAIGKNIAKALKGKRNG